jgi:hypothetical protein
MALDINRMTKTELTALKGITDQLADAIIARRRSAAFTSLDELASVPGVDQKLVMQLKTQGAACSSSDDEESGDTFVCRSCGRDLPASERETSNHFNQHICIACFVNLNLWTMPTGGA